MTLCLLDPKQYMYTGVSKPQTVARGVIEDAHEYRPREFRCGSLGYLIDEIYRILSIPDVCLCFCFDTPPTYKKQLSADKLGVEYKGGRSRAPIHVTYQFEFALKMIQEIGFNYMVVDGYEADDCISSVIRKYGHVFDKIVIYSNDSDQYYLVNGKTSIMPTSTRGKTVNMSNYESITHKDKLIKYNTITLDKMIYSESGDNVPAISGTDSSRLMRLIPEVTSPVLGDNEILRTIVKNTCLEERSLTIFDMIAPVEITDDRCLLELGKTYDGELLQYFGIEFQSHFCRGYNRMANEKGEEMIESFLDILCDREVI